MSDDTDGEDKKDNNLIVFPGGKHVKPSDVGADYIVGQSNDVPVSDIIDPHESKEYIRKRINYVKNQDLVKAAKDGLGATVMIDLLIQEITEELSHLKFERRQAVKEGKNVAQHTMGRMKALKDLADLLIKQKESDRSDELDLKSPRFQAVFRVWMDFFNDAMEQSGIPSEKMDLVFQNMKANMIDWEKKMVDAR